MAAIEILEDVAYWFTGYGLGDLVGDAETPSRAAQYLTERPQGVLPTEPDKG